MYMVRDQGLTIRRFTPSPAAGQRVQRIVCLRLKGFSQRQPSERVGVSEWITGNRYIIR